MFRLFIIGFALSMTVLAETWSGTLIDAMCKGRDPANHTRQCAISCSKSGYGVLASGGRFIRFDDAGNAKALAALKASKKEKDLRAKVTGSLDGDVIKVDSIELE
jgi:hypothetical protein